MIKLKKGIMAAVILAACCIQPTVSCFAIDSYDSVVQEYGGRAEDYTYDITADGVSAKEIITFSKKEGKTYTETYIRKEASANSAYHTVIPAETKVLIWGFTSNGWIKVYCKNTEAEDVCGYIRNDLLQDIN